MKTTLLGNTGERVPVIGQGTWKMGQDPAKRSQEIEALRKGIENGATLIDTAEIYSGGESERIVAEAISDVRDQIFLVTKVWPANASYEGVLRAASESLERLRTDRIDLYLLHWPSAEHPIGETMRAMRQLLADGIVRYVGVSNFSDGLLAEAQDALGDHPVVCNQVVYNLNNRVIEKQVKPYCDRHHITVMAYSPLGDGNFPEPGSPERETLDRIGAKYGVSAYQVALNWLIAQENVIVIPKAATPSHAAENALASNFELSDEDIRTIAETFPLPDGEFQVRRL